MAITPIACGAERSNILEGCSGSSPFKRDSAADSDAAGGERGQSGAGRRPAVIDVSGDEGKMDSSDDKVPQARLPDSASRSATAAANSDSESQSAAASGSAALRQLAASSAASLPGPHGFSDWSQWDLIVENKSVIKDGHLACQGIAVQLAVSVLVAGGLCEKSLRQLETRGVALYIGALGDQREDVVDVSQVLSHAKLPVSEMMHGTMLGSDRYIACGLDVVPSQSLVQAVTKHARSSTEKTLAYELCDDRQRAFTLVVFKGLAQLRREHKESASAPAVAQGAEASDGNSDAVRGKQAEPELSFLWRDSHPCNADGSAAQKDEGKAMWLSLSTAGMTSFIERKYDAKEPHLFNLMPIALPEQLPPVAQEIPDMCGACPLCLAQMGLPVRPLRSQFVTGRFRQRLEMTLPEDRDRAASERQSALDLPNLRYEFALRLSLSLIFALLRRTARAKKQRIRTTMMIWFVVA